MEGALEHKQCTNRMDCHLSAGVFFEEMSFVVFLSVKADKLKRESPHRYLWSYTWLLFCSDGI